MDWTAEQQEAINKENSNIIVSAGAGSGKTAVLSERVLRKVKSGIDIRQILILTFTNEAAGEMKNRIREKLAKNNLTKQLEYIDSAYITTFDAYALSIVKKYHYLLNIDKLVSIVDSSIINLKKNEILEEIFNELYTTKEPNFLKLIGDFTTRDDETIKEAILNINNVLDLKYDKEEYLTKYITNFYEAQNIEQLFTEYFNYLQNITILIEEDIYALENIVDDKLYLKLYDAFSPVFKPQNYNSLYKIKNISMPQFRNVSEEAIPYKESLKKHKEELLELTKYSAEELKNQILSTKPYVEIIIKIIKELDNKLSNYKKHINAFEFVDIAKMAIKIVLENPEICNELKATYNEILIDEYQDTNDLQEMFINKIENNNVYMVGDIKQSIYRFRNANPNIFKRKYDAYSKAQNGVKIDLLNNFRSRQEVLANINEIFNLIMTEDIGGVNYQNNHAMIYGNLSYIKNGQNNYNKNMEIMKYHNEDKKYSNTEIEAFSIAFDIQKKIAIKYQVYDFSLKKNRDIKYSDFCIILDRGTEMPQYKKIFEFQNIPMDVYKDSNLIIENDILIIKNIITLIILITEEDYGLNMKYAFTSIARSFIGNLTDAEIFSYLHNFNFFETDIYHKCQSIAKDIDNLTPNSLLNTIINEFSFYENYIKVGNIKAAIIRLDYLLDLASSMEDLGFTIKDFQNYLDEMIRSKEKIRYKEQKEDSDCVKIMNIHKSKGLEFPICYFAGLTKTFNLKELNNRFMFDSKYGILTPFYQEGIGTLFTKTLIKNKYYQDEISEKIRLFYVALTRAKEKIIMILPEFKEEKKQIGKIDVLTGLKYRSFYDFINSISLNLKPYFTTINLNKIPLTKDYDISLNNATNNIITNKKITFSENAINSKQIDNKHASKTINNIITKDEQKTMDFGTNLHEMLELTDFKKANQTNKYIKNLQENFDFQTATIYQELEFIYTKDDIEYHGIIDLMLEYKDEIKIIDYKLKNIEDQNYEKQLNIYYDYINRISSKKINLYLYSLLDNKIKEIDVINT